MRVRYHIERLTGLVEADLDCMAFDRLDRCPVCDAATPRDLSALAGSLTTALCATCHHVFQRRRPVLDWYRRWYETGWDAPERGTGAVPPRGPRRGLLAFCHPIVTPGARVLDVGCGYGHDLLAFREAGCEVFGIEASPRRAAAAREAGIHVANVRVENLDLETFGTEFDLVTANHVLEHAHDPHAFLGALRRVSRPGGWICLTVPDLENDFLLHDFFFALHPHFFSRASLLELAGRHGLVARRTLLEHQIRVLLRPGGKVAIPSAPRETGALGCQDAVARTLGPDAITRANEPYFIKWRLAEPRLDRLFEVRYELERDPLEYRTIRVRHDGELTLPLRFEPESGGRAPFWVK